jgi:hypothetical protein
MQGIEDQIIRWHIFFCDESDDNKTSPYVTDYI